MTISRSLRRNWPGRAQMLFYGICLVAIGLYFAVLHVLDGRAATYFQLLRQSDPELYLTQLRESRSFAAYVLEYREMEGYGTFQEAAPSFLVGRWTMRDEPLRLTPGTAPAQCSNPITFDYGILLLLQAGEGTRRVSYRIEDQTVQVKTDDMGTFPVELVSYGARLDHIEFTPPGMDKPVYAYNCGR